MHSLLEWFSSGAALKALPLLVGVMLLGGSAFPDEGTGKRPMVALAGLASLVLGLGMSFGDSPRFWGWVLAAVPPVLVVHHALFLSWMRDRFIPEHFDVSHARPDLAPLMEEAKRSSNSYFNRSNITLRLGGPALLLFVAGVTVATMLMPGADILKASAGWSDGILHASRFGAAGAYTYVLVYLGRRSFQHDISSGAALWCGVTMALGPVLAVVVSLVGKPPPPTDEPWSWEATYFFAGMAPRYVAQVIDFAVRRLLTGSAGVAQLSYRSVPLGQVGGVTPEVEERLGEEGVYDVFGLSMVDPHKLLRNTPFGKKQILDWMDQALLIRSVPNQWQKLAEVGITGALDLAWYDSEGMVAQGMLSRGGGTSSGGGRVGSGAGGGVAPAGGAAPAGDAGSTDGAAQAGGAAGAVTQTGSTGAPQVVEPRQISPMLQLLAEQLGMKPELLADISRRLAEDAQVRMVYSLYQLETTEVSVTALPAKA